MKKWEFALRVAAYACGLGGVLVAVRGPMGGPGRTAAYALLGAMLAAFVAANLLRLVAQWRALRGPRGDGRGGASAIKGAPTKASPPP